VKARAVTTGIVTLLHGRMMRATTVPAGSTVTVRNVFGALSASVTPAVSAACTCSATRKAPKKASLST
jgi:hypothetical protein